MSARAIEWSAEMIADLRTMRRRVFAERYHMSLATVSTKRRRLGISEPRVAQTSWTEAMLADLHVLRPIEVARKYGLKPYTVSQKRVRLGLARRPGAVLWTDKMLEDVRTLRYRDFAVRHDLCPATYNKKRRDLGLSRPRGGPLARIATPEEFAWLGKEPDNWVADRLNVDRSTVASWRRAAKIPSKTVRAARHDAVIAARASGESLMGVAARLGLTPMYLRLIARQLGCPWPDARHKPVVTVRKAAAVCLVAIGFKEVEVAGLLRVSRQRIEQLVAAAIAVAESQGTSLTPDPGPGSSEGGA